MSNSEIVVTIKGDGTYESPWVVVHGNTVAEVADQIGAMQASGFFTLVSDAATQAKAEWVAHKGLGTTPVESPVAAAQQYVQPAQQAQQAYQPAPAQQYQPQAPQGGYQQQQGGAPEGPKPGGRLAPPQGTVVPACPHGQKDLVNGKYGPFWGCPAQQGDPSKCKIEKYYGAPIPGI